jgi:hypothetical protein
MSTSGTTRNADDAEDVPRKLWEKLLRGISSAVELRVITIVSDLPITGEFRRPEVTLRPNTSNAIATSINLIEGDITSAAPESMWSPDRAVIREFHQAQIDRGGEIVERNIRLVSELGSALAKAIGELRSLESDDS